MSHGNVLAPLVAAILEGVDLEFTQEATLVSLVDIFLVELRNYAHFYSTMAGRTELVLCDVLLPLVKMGIRISDIERCRNIKCIRHIIKPVTVYEVIRENSDIQKKNIDKSF